LGYNFCHAKSLADASFFIFIVFQRCLEEGISTTELKGELP